MDRKKQLAVMELVKVMMSGICLGCMIPTFLFGGIGMTGIFLFFLVLLVTSGCIGLYLEHVLYERKKSEKRRVNKKREINSTLRK